jgi:hypothetical protein
MHRCSMWPPLSAWSKTEPGVLSAPVPAAELSAGEAATLVVQRA